MIKIIIFSLIFPFLLKASESNNQLLLVASKEGNADAIEHLIKNGANVNTKDELGETPLHKAVFNSHLSTSKTLLIHGADPNIKSSEGETPFFIISDSNDPANVKYDFMKLLIKYNADVNTKDEQGRSPLTNLTWEGHHKGVNLLLKNGADVNIRDKYLDSPLHLSAETNDSYLTKLFISKGAEVNATDIHGQTPLHVAGSLDDLDIAKILSKHKANFFIKDHKGKTAYDLFSKESKVKVKKLFDSFQLSKKTSGKTNNIGKRPKVRR